MCPWWSAQAVDLIGWVLIGLVSFGLGLVAVADAVLHVFCVLCSRRSDKPGSAGGGEDADASGRGGWGVVVAVGASFEALDSAAGEFPAEGVGDDFGGAACEVVAVVGECGDHVGDGHRLSLTEFVDEDKPQGPAAEGDDVKGKARAGVLSVRSRLLVG